MRRTSLAAAAAFAAAYTPTAPAPTLTDVFVGGKEGYACYRIPALLALGGGRLLAFAEARRYSCDDHGWVDLAVKASDDGGATWGALLLVHGESSPARNVTIGNPAPVLLPNGTVLLPMCRDNTAWGTLASHDGGATWVGPAYQPTPAGWSWIATGPPGSAVLGSGRVVVPFDYIPPGAGGQSSSVWVSDDGGGSWSQGGTVAGGNECQAVPLPWVNDSALLLSMRATAGPQRLVAVSGDGGATFTPPWGAVRETQCEGSAVALPRHPAGPRVYLTSAFSTAARANLTLHVTGGGDLHTWTPRVNVYPGGAAYSSLAAGPGPADLAVLFERDDYTAIAFAALPDVPA